MTRFSIIAAIFLTGAFATLLVNLQTPPQPALSRIDECDFNDRTRELVVSYHCFKNTLTTMLESLTHGEIGLEEARDRVYEAALCHNPNYLRHLATSERGATPQERVARNLLGHLRFLQEANPAFRVRLRALELEFAELQRRAGGAVPQS